MKRILATAAIVAMSATAFAGGDLDLRSGYTGFTRNTTGTTTQTGIGGLGMDRARIGFSGSVGSVSGKVQLDMLSAGSNTGAASTAIGGLVKYAEITNKWNDNMSLSAGRLDDTGMGGNEAMRSTGDQYFTSATYMKNYFGGLRFGWTISDSNTLKIYLGNENFNTSGTGTAQGYGLQYVGAAGDFGYMASYHTFPMTVTGQPSATNTYINLGLNYKMNEWAFAFDYNMNTYGKQSVATAGSDATKNSMILMVDYNMGNWVPQLKYESSTVTDLHTNFHLSNDQAIGVTANPELTASTGICTNAAACAVAASAYTIGTEYKPNPSDKFRYHFMYTGKTFASSGAGATSTNKTVTSTTVVAGFRWQADFLK